MRQGSRQPPRSSLFDVRWTSCSCPSWLSTVAADRMCVEEAYALLGNPRGMLDDDTVAGAIDLDERDAIRVVRLPPHCETAFAGRAAARRSSIVATPGPWSAAIVRTGSFRRST